MMEDEFDQPSVASGAPQLNEEHARRGHVQDAFSRQDEDGRTPIDVISQRTILYLNGLIAAAGVVAIVTLLATAFFDLGFLALLGFVLAGVLAVLGILRWFYVLVPEGANGLVTRVGRYQRTVGSGLHVLPPPFTISHFVTRRRISFDVPI